MKKFKCLSTLLSTVFAVACLQVTVSGQSADDKNRIATAVAGGDTVRFEVAVPYSVATLTVSAPNGKVYRKEFKAGTTPSLKLADKLGARLPDGQYTYELRLTPVLSAELRKELAATRDKNEDAADEVEGRVRGALPSHPLVQSGAFSVQNGAIIVAGAIEAESSRPTAKMGMGTRQASPMRAGYSDVSSFDDRPVFMPAFASLPTGSPRFVRGLAHAAFPDDVIPDDLIVQGSACVGLDCVNNENFGFDTIRLKENNTRIQFDDTSTSAGFPTNNWQIRANDSGSGGASFLGFVDQGNTGNSETGTVVLSVAAGAPANSIKVDSSGRLGIKTATPVLDVHANNSNTPAIRLEQNSSGGFTAQTWDIGANEANFFVRDVTGGSLLPFRIRPGAPTSSIDIAANGTVGIGIGSPSSSSKLHVRGSGQTNIFIDENSSTRQDARIFFLQQGTTRWQLGADLTSNNTHDFFIFDQNAVAARLYINSTGNVGIGTTAPTELLSVNGSASKPGGGSWSNFSDERLKNIRGKFNSGLKAVMQLQPLRYEYKRNNALGLNAPGEHIGFGAQALQKIIPEAVTSSSSGYLQVNNDPIIWTMLNAIKEQQKEIEQLKAQVRRLQSTSRKRR